MLSCFAGRRQLAEIYQGWIDAGLLNDPVPWMLPLAEDKLDDNSGHHDVGCDARIWR
jgi:hypothetical protein